MSAELRVTCPTCKGTAMLAHCGRTDNGSDGPCVLAPHNGPCYGEGDVASDWSPVSTCRTCCVCECGSTDAERGDPVPCRWCGKSPTPGSVLVVAP